MLVLLCLLLLWNDDVVVYVVEISCEIVNFDVRIWFLRLVILVLLMRLWLIVGIGFCYSRVCLGISGLRYFVMGFMFWWISLY